MLTRLIKIRNRKCHYCLIYLDDLIMFSQTAEEHLHQLHVVFD